MKGLKFINVTKEFSNGVIAVKNISFETSEDDFLVLVGPSGCGKTTILRMIAGLEDITSGEVSLDSKVINDVEPKNRNIGMVFQNYALYPHLTVFENIAFPLRIKKVSKKEIKITVGTVAESVGLHEYLHRKPKELSGGQRQRVALARAIVRKPDLFLFDEPLSNLDANLRIQMRSEILQLHRKTGCVSVYVTHDQIEAMTMGTKIAVIKDGEIHQIGTPEQIYNQPADLFVAEFIGNPKNNFIDVFVYESHTNLVGDAGKNIMFNYSPGLKPNIKEYTIALRPEYFSLHPIKNNENYFESTIENKEYLGAESYVYFKLNSKIHCLKAKEMVKESIGDKINIYYDKSRAVFFDKTTGRNIANNI